MISKETFINAKKMALEYYKKANIIITPEEQDRLEVADFGLNDLWNVGLEIITYINTDRVCSKEMVLFPNQTCPEHKHPNFDLKKGKEETFRCRYGEVFLFVEGIKTKDIEANIPNGEYSVFHQIKLLPGEQYTIYPNTLHWFQAGKTGAVISEFSTNSNDDSDIFTDKRIKRIPEIS